VNTLRRLLAALAGLALLVVMAVQSYCEQLLTAAEIELWLQQPYEQLPQGTRQVLGVLYKLGEQPGTGEGTIRPAYGEGLPPESLRPPKPADVLLGEGLVVGIFDSGLGQAYYLAPAGWPTRLLRESANSPIVPEARQLTEGVAAARVPFVSGGELVLFEVDGGHVANVRVHKTLTRISGIDVLRGS
jgi:hypothetical protein